MLGYLLSFIFCCVVCLMVYKISGKNSLLPPYGFLLFAFVAKVLVGCLYGYYYSNVLFEADTWKYFKMALVEYDWLLNNPTAFVKDLFTNGYASEQHNTFFAAENSFWKDLSNNILVKLLACMQLIAQRNYYATVALFSCITFAAPIFVCKLITENNSAKNKWLLYFIFLWPPILFFTSGIHKDGLLFACLAACIYFFIKFVTGKQVRCLVYAAIFLLLLFLLRSFMAATLVPFLLLYMVQHEKKLTFKKYGIAVIVLLSVGIMVSSFLPNSLNILHIVTERRNSFLQLQGNSLIDTTVVQPSFTSLASYFFVAVKNAFIEPHFFNAMGLMGIVSAVNNMGLLLCFVWVAFVWQQKKAITIQPIWLLLLPFCFINYLVIGYTVPFSGAIVRYKSIFEFLLLLFCMEHIVGYYANKRLYN
jgi:hypothetical protein